MCSQKIKTKAPDEAMTVAKLHYFFYSNLYLCKLDDLTCVSIGYNPLIVFVCCFFILFLFCCLYLLSYAGMEFLSCC